MTRPGSARRAAAHAAAAALGGGVLAAQARNVPVRQAPLLRAAAAVVAAEAVTGAARDWARQVVAAQSEPFEEHARTALAVAYFQLVAAGAAPEALGVQAYVVSRRAVPPFERHLRRVAKIRLGSGPPGSKIWWTRGKGVIGRCWDSGQAVLMDTGAAYAPWADASPEQWAAAPDDVRLGLAHDEFARIVGKYAVVVATPVFGAQGRVRGCVVADVLAGQPGGVLFDDRSQAVLADAAAYIGQRLRDVPPWVYR